ncbi:MAG: hypothetical protein E7048_00040 [Lentisphaerae bacterium]|nr:hypothetical protein [Lentisphaerota bacterium]
MIYICILGIALGCIFFIAFIAYVTFFKTPPKGNSDEIDTYNFYRNDHRDCCENLYTDDDYHRDYDD